MVNSKLNKGTYNKDYYKKNRKRIIEQNSTYYDKHKGKILDDAKKKRRKHDEEGFRGDDNDYYNDDFIWGAF